MFVLSFVSMVQMKMLNTVILDNFPRVTQLINRDAQVKFAQVGFRANSSYNHVLREV